MLQRVKLEGIELPRLYLAETTQDQIIAMKNGIPFVAWKGTMEEFIKMLFRPALEEMFPYIKWNEVLGPKKKFKTKVQMVNGGQAKLGEVEHIDNMPIIESESEVADIATRPRYFDGSAQNTVTCSLETYMGDLSSSINVDVLQRLQMMPQFIGDIVNCIKANRTASLKWNEGYNKKLGAAVGVYNRSQQLPNLIILDVSGSIPRGISATMIQLIDTLRTQVNADLIITSSTSKFYSNGEELPSPEKIRQEFGRANESIRFIEILKTKLVGKEYGYVFSFGDYDTPCIPNVKRTVRNIKVHHVVNFHTEMHMITGYADWTKELADKPVQEFNCDWCNIIKE